jgi:hypothetical protein
MHKLLVYAYSIHLPHRVSAYSTQAPNMIRFGLTDTLMDDHDLKVDIKPSIESPT